MITLITGKSGSGKTAIVKELNEIYGLKKAVNYTTRTPRLEEFDSSDYEFLIEYDFIKRLKKGFFLEHVVTPDGFYGIPKPETNDFFIILEPCGMSQVVKYCEVNKIPYMSIFLDVSDEVRKDRMIADGADNKRLDRDENYFDVFKPIYNHVLDNNGTLEDIIGKIRYKIEGENI